MDLNQSPLGKVPDLTGLIGKVALGLAGRRTWLWRFLGILLLTAAVGGPVTSAGGVYQETSPSAKVQKAWLTSHFSVAARTFPQTITFDQPPDATVGTPVPLSATASPSGLAVLFSSDTLPVCTVADSTVTTVAVGTCTITASQSGRPSAAAPDVTRSFQVRAPGRADDHFRPAARCDGRHAGPPVGARVRRGCRCCSARTRRRCAQWRGSTVTTVAVGTCTITAYQAREARQVAPDVSRSFQVNPVRARPGSADDHVRAAAQRDGRHAGRPVGARVVGAGGVVQLGHAVGVHGGGFHGQDRGGLHHARSRPRRAGAPATRRPRT